MDAATSRPQRIGLGVAGAGFLLSVAGAVILQIDPSRMLDVHHVLHRTGMAVMLAGLTAFLVPSIARRHCDRIRRTARALREAVPFAAAPALRAVGAALMAFAIAGEIVIRIIGDSGDGFFLIAFGTPGLLIWLTGVILGLLAGAGRIGRSAARPTGSRATPAYRPWSETPAESSGAGRHGAD